MGVEHHANANKRLPSFSSAEISVKKRKNVNTLQMAIPVKSSLLMKLLKPKCHSYEEKDLRWIHALQAIAMVPSKKYDEIQALAKQAMRLVPTPPYKKKLERALTPLLNEMLGETKEFAVPKNALLALKLKDQVSNFLREWMEDPIEGFVFYKEHVLGDLRLDDLVATPIGEGYLRGYRPADDFCIVIFPFGHGFIHKKDVKKVDDAIAEEKKTKQWKHYIALEHQKLYEEIESLVDNLPPEALDKSSSESSILKEDGINIQEYKKLIESLRQDHFDVAALEDDLSFLRRAQMLAAKTKPARTDT